MVKSRLHQRYRRRTALSLVLSVLLVVGLVVGSIMYLPELILGITSINSKFTSQQQNTSTSNDTIAPLIPQLDPLPEATSDDTLTIAGTTEAGAKVYLYRNGSKISTVPADKNGEFKFKQIKLSPDKNEFYAVAEDFTGNQSDPSTPYTVTLQTEGPKLEASGEVDNNTGKASITGTTDATATVTINRRRAIVSRSGSFSLKLKLTEGENKMLVVATDPVGNTTEQELILNYSPEN